jgi:hypothetical protein
MAMPSPGIESRTLRVLLRMFKRAYGAQQSDCISAAFGDIPGEVIAIPPTDRFRPSELKEGGAFLSEKPLPGCARRFEQGLLSE